MSIEKQSDIEQQKFWEMPCCPKTHGPGYYYLSVP
ncbi:hypothetical protein SMSP2_00780 [Limihaloglobus sulfuriphilus]|uniref:Uncharacterized protein n=1 Tax=Limihaloglobus sulfuriphilus TaxID=1851148 RepID=A0A1Q2MDU2_9BACT|nr:hypothetical protein SMSP2_00780 [Limihaloglobus sulfuriphilus]